MGGSTEVLGKLVVLARCRGQALLSAGGLGGRAGTLAACLFSTELRFLLGNALVGVQADLFAVRAYTGSCSSESWLHT